MNTKITITIEATDVETALKLLSAIREALARDGAGKVVVDANPVINKESGLEEDNTSARVKIVPSGRADRTQSAPRPAGPEKSSAETSGQAGAVNAPYEEGEPGGMGSSEATESNINNIVDDLLKKVVASNLEEDYPSEKKESKHPQLLKDILEDVAGKAAPGESEEEEEDVEAKEGESGGEDLSGSVIDDALLAAFTPQETEDDEELLRKRLEEIKRRKIVG